MRRLGVAWHVCLTGIAALQMLNILEHFNLTEMGFNSADYLHVHIEASSAQRHRAAVGARTRACANPWRSSWTAASVGALPRHTAGHARPG